MVQTACRSMYAMDVGVYIYVFVGGRGGGEYRWVNICRYVCMDRYVGMWMHGRGDHDTLDALTIISLPFARTDLRSGSRERGLRISRSREGVSETAGDSRGQQGGAGAD